MSVIDDSVDAVAAAIERYRGGDLRLVLGTMVGIYALYLLVGLALGFDFNGQVNALQRITYLTAVYAMAALALNLHWGYTGLFNVGIAGFMAVGVYAMGVATAPANPASGSAIPGFGLPMPVGILLGMLAAALFGLVAALPALRLRSDYLAIVTLGMAEIVRLSLTSSTLQRFTLFGKQLGLGGNGGLRLEGDPSRAVESLFREGWGIDPVASATGGVLDAFAPVGIEQPVVINIVYALVVVVVLVGVYWMLARIGNSPFGRVLKAIREDEDVASSLGKNTRMVKIKSFVIGCALLGLAGILWQGSRGLATPNTFKTELTVFVWVVVIIGGAGSNTGTVLGAALFTSLLLQGPRFLRDIIRETFEVPRAPSSVYRGLEALAAADPGPLVAYVFDWLSAVQFIVLGVVLILIIQRRPEGLLGHRKEPAAAIDISGSAPDGDPTEGERDG